MFLTHSTAFAVCLLSLMTVSVLGAAASGFGGSSKREEHHESYPPQHSNQGYGYAPSSGYQSHDNYQSHAQYGGHPPQGRPYGGYDHGTRAGE